MAGQVLTRFAGAVRRVWSRVGASWVNVVTVVLVGLAAAVSAAAGWDPRHHLLWFVAAAVIAALGGLAQLSRQARPGLLADAPDRPHSAVRLGAWRSKDRVGTDFSVFSRYATGIDLCLLDADGNEQRRIALSKHPSAECVWHGYVRGAGAGQRYGYRVSGEYKPTNGQRFNPAKLLIDPYARAIERTVDWDGPVFGYPSGPDGTVPDGRDSAKHVPYSVVVDDAYDWGDDRRPNVPWTDTVIYDVHVRGFTIQHPPIQDVQPGTYAAMGSLPVTSYLKDLGVTTLLLMPVHHFVSERAVVKRKLTNYWGYNPIGYFAPEARYSSAGAVGGQVREFKAMARSLHAAGIEVIIDVVFSHTAEGDHLGPHLCFRGIDNRSYYRLSRDRRHYQDYSNCGNSLNVADPQVLELIMDSLRYWVQDMHVDGFRLDYASALARNLHEAGTLSKFFDLITQDAVISQVKLIAESWDVGEGGYQVDTFPALWAELNDSYRDAVRRFWRSASRTPHGDSPAPEDASPAPEQASPAPQELARRLTGSLDLCPPGGRKPGTSINFITCHDGFTLHDLVSYSRKHNEANGEAKDPAIKLNDLGICGAEGPTDDPQIQDLRERQKRNLLTTLLLSAGVPLLLAGDEMGRTQRGNDNAYCQDNDISWVNWQLDERGTALLEFTRQLLALRAAHPVFRRRRPFQGQQIRDTGMKDVHWFTPDGTEMIFTSDSAEMNEARPQPETLGMFLNGHAVFGRALQGERIADSSFLLLFNAATATVRFTLPGPPWATGYQPIIDTSKAPASPDDTAAPALKAGDTIRLEAASVLVLRATRESDNAP